MTLERHAPPAPRARRPDPERLAGRSLWMFAVFLLALVVATLLGNAFLAWLGLQEGELLLSVHDVRGWIAELVVTGVMLAPPLAGSILALRAYGSGAGRRSLVALVLHGALVLWVLFLLVDDIRMGYRLG